MKKTNLWVLLSLVVILFIIFILFFKIKTAEAPLLSENNNQEENYFEDTIDVLHQFKDGKHIFFGKIETPTPCHEVVAQIFPGEIPELNIEIKDSGKICAQVITEQVYKIDFEAPENQKFSAKLNNKPVNINIFEIKSELNIEEVEIFNKG